VCKRKVRLGTGDTSESSDDERPTATTTTETTPAVTPGDTPSTERQPLIRSRGANVSFYTTSENVVHLQLSRCRKAAIVQQTMNRLVYISQQIRTG
jgi:hypothetical protein